MAESAPPVSPLVSACFRLFSLVSACFRLFFVVVVGARDCEGFFLIFSRAQKYLAGNSPAVNGWFKLFIVEILCSNASSLIFKQAEHPTATHTHKNTKITTLTIGQWPEQRRLHASQLGERHHAFILQQTRLHKS
jgi:hypothetical protein